eukprot:TRINITY_DN24338_c0_g1_i1.p1 TRINITY_DN24338_c0_g1~~TRINITY_DN24338_c0_g1_i1.p1  ORF type:complete len:145 (-),score=2.70 TRINITY_DN24338_c0_g1_i1:72-506(-)
MAALMSTRALSSAASVSTFQAAPAASRQQSVCRPAVTVRCHASDEKVMSRRSAAALSLAALLVAVPASSASAKDIPIFGIRKKVEEAPAPVTPAPSAPVAVSAPAPARVVSESDIPAETQAAAVAAVEVVAVLAAGAVVKSVTS